MIDLIERHRDELADLCRRHHVRTLEVFGSAADGTFNPATSDLDFLVEFLPLTAGELRRFTDAGLVLAEWDDFDDDSSPGPPVRRLRAVFTRPGATQPRSGGEYRAMAP